MMLYFEMILSYITGSLAPLGLRACALSARR